MSKVSETFCNRNFEIQNQGNRLLVSVSEDDIFATSAYLDKNCVESLITWLQDWLNDNVPVSQESIDPVHDKHLEAIDSFNKGTK